jgi:hypothetical protein
MSGRVVPDASITIPLDGTSLDAAGIASDDRLSALLRSALDALTRSTPTSRIE